MVDVEICRLDAGALLYSPVSSAMVVTDALGCVIRDAVQAGLPIPGTIAAYLNISQSEAAAIADHVLGEWEAAGLFEAEPRSFIDPPAHRPAGEAVIRTYRLNGNAVTLVCEDPHLAAQIHGVLALLGHDSGPGGDELLEILDYDGRYGVFNGGEPLFGKCGINAARYLVVRDMFERLAGRDRAGASIHAGSVGQGGRALILAGSSGAGKTTLTLGLAMAGCDYLADDHVVLDQSGTRMVALPVKASAKAPSWGLAEVAPLLAPEDQPMPRYGVRPAMPPGAVPMGSEHEVAAVVFPGFNAEAENRLERLTPQDAFLRLIESGARPARQFRSIAPIAKLLDTVPCYAMQHNSSEFSVPACLDLLRNPAR